MKGESKLVAVALSVLLTFFITSIHSCTPRKVAVERPPVEEKAAREAAPQRPTISSIIVEKAPDESRWTVDIIGAKDMVYSVVKEPAPLSLKVFIPGLALGDVPSEIPQGDQMISRIESVSTGTPESPMSEITIFLNGDARYQARLEEDILKITIFPHPEEEEVSGEKPAPVPAVAEEEREPFKIEAEARPVADAVRDIKVRTKYEKSAIQIIANGVIKDWTDFTLKRPNRLVIDLPGVTTLLPRTKIIPENQPFDRIRIGQRGDKMRIVLDFLRADIPPYSIFPEENVLWVILGKKALPAEGLPPKKVAKMPEKAAKAKGPVAYIRSLEFKQMDDKSRILISLDRQADFKLTREAEDTLVLYIKRARIPKRLKRFMDTSSFYSSVQMIKPGVDRRNPDNVRIEVKLRNMAPYFTGAEGNNIYLDIEKPEFPPPEVVLKPVKGSIPEELMPEEKKAPTGPEGAAPPALKVPEVGAEEVPPMELKPEEVAKKITPVQKPIEEAVEAPPEEAVIAGAGQKIYTGKRISLDFQDADIIHVFRLIAEVSGLNIVIGENVKGRVTVRLVNVPWDQALDVILESNGLDKERIGNVIRIAPAEEIRAARLARLEEERKRKEAIRKAAEEEEKAEPPITRLMPVNFAKAADMVSQIKGLLSDRGTVSVDNRTNTLIIKDVRANVERAIKLIKSLDTPTPQVLIEARIVEVNSNFRDELGIQWGTRYVADTLHGNSIAGNTLSIYGRDIAGNQAPSGSNWIVNMPAATGPGSGGALGLTLGTINNVLSLDIQLSALEEKSLVRILSKPRVTTLDNEQAKISQGTKIPYLKQTEDGISTEFIEAVLELEVTPSITPDGNISMSIRVTKNEPDWSRTGPQGDPAIETRNAETKVLVRDGETTVIGGIVTSTEAGGLRGVPRFSKMPFLGWLFKHKNSREERKEMIIFITPRIVKQQPMA